MIVTRFAPSPTGYLHVGGARTAIFNWLLARKHGGRFILRIEDTDQKRNTPTAMRQVIQDLRWLGVEWDEGPEVEGPNGPYLQSQRREIYDKYVALLLEQGRAYYCFDTPEELEARRMEAEKNKEGFVCRRPERLPDAADVKRARDEGRPITVRFAVPQDKDIVVEDIVRGQVRFAPGELSDFIIQKSDGFPTYHFACVVDDELMEVTHVLRGQEHLMNTPLHQVLQEALGFRTPVYAHMSVTVSEGGGKLSKRERPKALRNELKTLKDTDLAHLAEAGGIPLAELEAFLSGDSTPDMPAVDAMARHLGVHLPEINVVDFEKSGYLPETMVNFLALLGWNPGDDREIMRTEELIEAFDLGRLSKSNSLFDRNKLLSFNMEHMKMVEPKKLAGHFRNYLRIVDSPVLSADDDMLERLLRINEGARTLEQVEQKSRFAFVSNEAVEYDEKAVAKVLLKGNAFEMLGEIARRLTAMADLTPESLEGMLRGLAEEKGVGLGKVAQPLRVALSGSTVSMGIFESIEILGLKKTLERIEITIRRFSETGNQ